VSPDGLVVAMTVFDDGRGPALYVGGNFSKIGDKPLSQIARWDGTEWSDVGGGTSGWFDRPYFITYAFGVWNDDERPALVAGGHFKYAGGVLVNGLAKWDGQQWSAFGTGVGGREYLPYENVDLGVDAIAAFTDGHGSALFVGGLFGTIDDTVSLYIARYGAVEPRIEQHPAHRRVEHGQAVQFSARATGSGPLRFQWRQDGRPLEDDGRIQGATTGTLTISPTRMADAGSIDVVVTDDCGWSASRAASLRVVCPGDLDGDAAVELEDLATLLSCFALGSYCGDLDGDDDTDLADLRLLLSAWGQSCD
jgi:hypothetical protein